MLRGLCPLWPLEGRTVKPSSFAPPDPQHAGDVVGGLLLCDAGRLSLRSGAAPFRSLGRVSVAPRPYQFVPLIMALRMHPVRLLIADDVGVGKTIEAALIARELLDRGLARRLAVLCPAHLCDQWATELREKFALDPRVVQPAQIARLQRDLPRADRSVYDYYPHLVLSIDFVKSDRQRDHFLRFAPDLVIVDEAHIASRPRGERDRVQHERVRHWAAIALLRCLLSSPDAADAVLSRRMSERAREDTGDSTVEDIDALYRPQVLDPLAEENVGDYVPTAPVEDAEPYLSDHERRRPAGFRRHAQALADPTVDRKLSAAADAVADLLRGGFRPIVFCRFISTAKYLERMLPRLLGNAFPCLRVVAVTGEIGDEERRAKVDELVKEPVRVLVATDCLSEGVNLQDHFDAAVHIVRRKDEARCGEYRTKRVILEMYDAMAEAMQRGETYRTRLDPPPADARVARAARVGVGEERVKAQGR